MNKEMAYDNETSITFINLDPLSLQIKFGLIKKFNVIALVTILFLKILAENRV